MKMLETPVLCKRIPTPPWGDPAGRKLVGFDQYVSTGGYQSLDKAMGLQPQQVIDIVKASELRGRGGAGFHAGVKWGWLAAIDGGRRYLVVNADEAEPGTFKDRLLIDYDPHLVIEGAAICMHACQLDTAYFYIRGEYHHQRKVFGQAIREAYDNHIFGSGSRLGRINDRDPQFILHRGAGAYICGEETGLLESLEGKRGWPRIKPPFPSTAGAFGRPTIINNVETLACVVPIIEHGSDWFKSMGRPRPADATPGTPASYGPKLYCVSGHVNKPGVYEDHLGIRLCDLIENHCGGIRGGKKFKAAIPGGISMGVLGPDQHNAELDFEIAKKYNCLGLGTAGVIVMDEDTDMVMVARNMARFFSHESCGQCTPCREGTTWMYKILCRIEQGQGKLDDLYMLLELAGSMGTMGGTTICGLADGANCALQTVINKFWDEFVERVDTAKTVPLPTLTV